MKFLFSLFSILLLLGPSLQAFDKSKYKNSVVRIHVSFQNVNYYQPWMWSKPLQKGGQGIVVGKDLVLTLASTISRANYIEMRMGTEPVGVSLIPKYIDYDHNIALLSGILPKGAQPMKIPEKNQFKNSGEIHYFWKTDTGRFLEGSANLDRVEAITIPPSNQTQLWMVATKASIRGGFGEPIFMNNEMIGIAVRSLGSDDFLIIPNETLHRSIDFEMGQAAPKTAMPGFGIEALTQQYLREQLGVADEKGGCLIGPVFSQGSGMNTLKTGDVLLSIAGFPVDPWGRYAHPQYGDLSFSHLFESYALDRQVPVSFMRDGELQKQIIDLATIKDKDWLVPRYREGEMSDYFIRGGFVFQPLSEPSLSIWGEDWRKKAPDLLLKTYEDNRWKIKSKDKDSIVLFSRVLSHPINRGFQHLHHSVVLKANGEKLKGLKHLKKIFDDTSNDTIRLSLLPGDIPLLLSKTQLKSADPDIKTLYNIRSLQYFSEN